VRILRIVTTDTDASRPPVRSIATSVKAGVLFGRVGRVQCGRLFQKRYRGFSVQRARPLLLITLVEGFRDRAGWAPRPPKLVLLKSLKFQALGHLDGLGGSFGQTAREMPDWPADNSE
jgi:hypothetical protein